MTEKTKTEETHAKHIKKQDAQNNGNKNLLIGTGFGAFGSTLVLTAGYVCPFCMVATPLFLGMGAVQKYKHLTQQEKLKTDNSKN